MMNWIFLFCFEYFEILQSRVTQPSRELYSHVFGIKTKLKITQRSKQVKQWDIYFHDEDKKWEEKCQTNFFGQLTLRDRMKFPGVLELVNSKNSFEK